MPNGIGFVGLGSGIDTDAIVRQLVALERLPIEALAKRKAAEETKIATLGTFKSLVLAFQERARAVRDLEDLLEFQISASEEGVADFRVSGAATAGTHTLTVNHTATIDRWAFDPVLDPEVDLASADGQEIKFTVDGETYSIAFDADASSLEEIAAAINAEAGEAVTASAINTGTSAAPSWRLILASRASGEDGRISDITCNVAGLGIDTTEPAADGSARSENNVVVGTNAEAVIDGITIERSTNEFSDVITGVTLTVEAADPDLETQFTIEPDYAAIQQKIVDFVDAYNAIVQFQNEQSSYDQESGPGGPLFGDSILSQVRSKLRSALFGATVREVQADELGYSTLGLVGVEMKSDGTLEIDEEKLEEKLQGDLDAFADLFVDSDGFDNDGAAAGTPGYYDDTTRDHGIADLVVRAVDQLVKTSTGPGGIVLKGAFSAKDAALDARIESIEDTIAAKERYLEMYEANLRRRFAALEKIMGGLNAQGSALAAITQDEF